MAWLAFFSSVGSKMMKDCQMSPYLRNVLLVALLANIGCGGGSTVPFKDNSQDTDAYAQSVKQAVADQVALAMTSSEPGDQIASIANLLENPDNRPQGPHESIYLEIRSAAQDIMLECSAAAEGRPDGLEESLTKLQALAEKLPGTVALTAQEPGESNAQGTD
jgi:hypothetical protein